MVKLVDRRLGEQEDGRAEKRGWTVGRGGRFGLTHVYRDPRWQQVADAAAELTKNPA